MALINPQYGQYQMPQLFTQPPAQPQMQQIPQIFAPAPAQQMFSPRMPTMSDFEKSELYTSFNSELEKAKSGNSWLFTFLNILLVILIICSFISCIGALMTSNISGSFSQCVCILIMFLILSAINK
jgi:hypothetical protein